MNEPDPQDPDSITLGSSPLMEALKGCTFRFWTCPVCVDPYIDWHGEKARCMRCGRTNGKT